MNKKDIIIGFVVGLIANIIGLFMATLFYNSNRPFWETLNAAISHGSISQLISFGAVLNLLAFFIFLKKKQEYRARGVLLATLFAAVLTFIIKFL
ncbi:MULTISPECIES: hypothetical protein [Mangrovimonas]|uniref:Uncharacterized protein n=2 Tax=Mangrovimonas TaxID=1211036 RepID=A0A3R9N9A8_9FLAO|nr:hypothetical protein [Mangrovimonas spongiae]RSK41945.1 hypothetical protein EJA19_03435 [Mangrovimonas spongiae]